MVTGLIVDDAAIMRLRLREILEPRYNVIGEAGDGQEALDLYSQLKPDFVTLDISMPHTNGIEALQKLMTRFDDPRVVIVSAVGQQRLVLEALKIGARDFVIKPFETDRVLKAVERIFTHPKATAK